MDDNPSQPQYEDEPMTRTHVTLKKRIYKKVKRDARAQKRTVAAHISFILERSVDGEISDIGDDFKVGGTG